MKIKELEVDFWENESRDDEGEAEGEFDDDESIVRALLFAVKNNFSLRSVKAVLFGSDLDKDDKQKLAFFANRNALLDQWVGNPETVKPRQLWPDALGLAERAGPDAMFCGLRSVLESYSKSLKGGRKRKRPQYYIPS